MGLVDSSRRGLVATGLAVAVAVGVIGAAILDSAGGSGAETTAAGVRSATPTASTRPAPSYFDQLNSLPAVGSGDLPGRVLIASPTCLYAWLDLTTLRPTPAPDQERRCRGGAYMADQAPGEPFLIIHKADGPPVRMIRIPRGWFAGLQTADAVALCSGDDRRAVLTRFRGGRRRLPSCPVGVIDDRLVFAQGRTLTDERGRQVLRLHQPIDKTHPIVQQLSPRLIVVEGLDTADLYGDGRYRASVRLSGVGDQCHVASVSRDVRTVLVSCPPGGALIVVRDGEAHAVNPLLASQDAVLSADGRWLLDHVSALPYGVVLDTRTLAPRFRLPLTAVGALAAWE
jgi:hypothetical protein